MYYNYMLPEERPTWKSANQIKITAMQHENRRVQAQDEDAARNKASRTGFVSLLKSALGWMAG